MGGAAFFESGSDVVITYKDGTVDRGTDIGFGPAISGGFQRAGFLAADGTEEIRLKYDFDNPRFTANARAPKDSVMQGGIRVGGGQRLPDLGHLEQTDQSGKARPCCY